MENNKKEELALKVGVAANLIMALAGYYIYYITRSEALLLDGNFSMIAVLVSAIAIYLTRIRHLKNRTFPFGLYFFESLFVFFKGLILIGVIMMALFQNGAKILHFFQGETIPPIQYGPILYYTIGMIIICFGMAFYFYRSYISIGKTSNLLYVESKSLVIDGVMSSVLGVSFLIMSLIPESSKFAFLHSIGDSLLVIVIGFIFLKTPLQITKNALIELGGGVLQDKPTRNKIILTIKESIRQEYIYHKSYIIKIGSSYEAIIYLIPNTDIISVNELDIQRKTIAEKLKQNYDFSVLEIIIM